ncbi:MAG: Trk system potassium transporter TrkA [Flavobacteriaceae bacterium]|jgi:trk system potassium uptake protein TrkA|nr:Trk system potassium transporter TrkA [Flavobacteriaceae bacterium]|tara:strand:- start:86 stop:1435 length:1350 start_codon:yes stop_codon:yes gene_type:complete
MKIVIAGAGEVGFHLAKLLSLESLEITLIDINKESLSYAESHLDIKTIKGNCVSISILKDASVGSSDLLIAVTAEETTNIMVASLSKQLGCKKTIARISTIEFLKQGDSVNFKNIGVDELISPEDLAANEIQELLDQSAFFNNHKFDNGALTLVGTTLEVEAPFVGKTVMEAASVYNDLHFMPVAIQRKDAQSSIIPRGGTIFNEGDIAYFITLREGVNEIYKLAGKVRKSVKNVMILGGGKLAFNTAKKLIQNKINVSLIEQNNSKAIDLADKLPDAVVIKGDGTNLELLEEENLNLMDAFISVTGNSETNIMSCLMANSKNVSKTVALVENMDYFKLSHSIGIDNLINKKLLTANTIFRYIRRGDVVEMTMLNNLDVEILEFIVHDQSKVCDKKIKDIDFPRSAIIGGVIKNGKGIIALGDYVVTSEDRVLVCCLSEALEKVESLFS